MGIVNNAFSTQPLMLSQVLMAAFIPRTRGVILRLVRRRGPAMLVGAALVVPSAWIEFSGRFDAWWVEGLALIGGATGLAILWTGLTGTSPDWTDDS
jgi:hypothetical protein